MKFTKYIFITSLLAFSANLMSMDNKNDFTVVTVKTAEKLDKIKKDGGVLYFYLKGAFQGMAKRNDPKNKPSHILKFLEENESANSKPDSMLLFMKVSGYLNLIISKHYTEFDEAFENKYNELKDVKQTWEWFDEYFKQNGIVTPLTAYKLALIKGEKEISN